MSATIMSHVGAGQVNGTLKEPNTVKKVETNSSFINNLSNAAAGGAAVNTH